MSPDILEGTAYHLPDKLNWEVVTNTERLTTSEMNSMSSETASAPTEILAKIVRAHDMKSRASEEVEILKKEMSRVVEFYSKEHSLLMQHIDCLNTTDSLPVFQQGCLNLLYHRLLLCEKILVHLSSLFSHHHNLSIPKLSLFTSDGRCTKLEESDVESASDSMHSDSSDFED